MPASGNRLISRARPAYIGCSEGKRGPRWRQPRCSPAGPAGGWAATRRPCAVGGVELASLVLAAAARVADPVVLVAPEGHPARRLAAPAVADPGQGPLAALAAALDALEADHVLVLAADHPGLRVPLLAHLVALAGEAEAVACRRGPRLEPLVAVYRRVPALAAGPGPAGRPGRRPLAGRPAGRPAHPGRGGGGVAPLDPDGRSFVDLDDPADLAAWEPGPALGCTARRRHATGGCAMDQAERARGVPGAGPLPARAEPAGGRRRRGRGHPGAGPGGRPQPPSGGPPR